MKKFRKIFHAEVIEQTPHPMFGPAPFAIVKFEGDGFEYLNMNRRRVKRETIKAMRRWRAVKKIERKSSAN